jgi:2-hydroxy-3-oxopropionate reductase
MLKVGYIGLGLMGKSMARNILKAGFPLVVHNRSQEAVQELAADGAQPASSPAEVAKIVDVVITNLPDSPDVEMVALGQDGIIEGAQQGLIFIDNSTIKPASARLIADKLGEKGVPCLDAPVSGRDPSWKQWEKRLRMLERQVRDKLLKQPTKSWLQPRWLLWANC